MSRHFHALAVAGLTASALIGLSPSPAAANTYLATPSAYPGPTPADCVSRGVAAMKANGFAKVTTFQGTGGYQTVQGKVGTTYPGRVVCLDFDGTTIVTVSVAGPVSAQVTKLSNALLNAVLGR